MTISPPASPWSFSAVWLLLTAFAVGAHNGEVALVAPMGSITVDGDFADWPQDLPRYPIVLKGGGELPRDARDLTASFRIGYAAEDNALYLAIEVEDESVVIAAEATPSGWSDWDAEDGCEIVLHAQHQDPVARVVQLVVYGDDAKVFIGGKTLPLAAGQLGLQRTAQQHRYEWRLDMDALAPERVALKVGAVLGLDLAICDKDADESFTWTSWGRYVAKDASADYRADILLLGPAAPLGQLRGRMTWPDGQTGVAHGGISIAAADLSSALVVTTDGQGYFDASLPAGHYDLQAVVGRADAPVAAVELRPGAQTRLHLVAPAPMGQTQRVGADAVVRSGAGVHKGAWHAFGVPDGLPSYHVEALLQDGQGDLWLGTGSGVARFDGEYFTTFTTADGLAGDQINAIYQDERGDLWFGTGRGVARFDGEYFTTFTTADGLAGDQVNAIYQDGQGDLWFGTQRGGVSRFDGEHFTTFTTADGLAGDQVNAIVADRDGTLFFATQFDGISRFDDGRFTTFSIAAGLADPAVVSLAPNREGGLWVGTSTAGVFRFDGQRFTALAAPADIKFNSVEALHQAGDGQLWIGMGTGQIFRFDGQRFTALTPDGGQVRCVLEDRDGQLWLGTELGGVVRYDGDVCKTFTTADGLAHDIVQVILEDRRGHLWLGTAGGLSHYDGARFTTYAIGDGLADNRIYDLLEDRNGALWVATYGGVSRFAGGRFSTFSTWQGPTDQRAFCLLEDRGGQLLVGTAYAGVSRFDGERFKTHIAPGAGLTNMEVRALLQGRSGHLWFGAAGNIGTGAVGRYDGTSITRPTRGGRAVTAEIYALLEDREGILWLGTRREGVLRYDGEVFERLALRDGLAHNYVQTLFEDRQGDLWFGTVDGLSRYDGHLIQTLRAQDGLAGDRINDVLEDRRGDIWIATHSGLTRYRPKSGPPAIAIADVVADRRYGPVAHIDLSTAQDYLVFEFRGKSLLTRPGQMAYLYRLQGFDERWQPTRENRVEYANLPRGDYLFEVKAVDRDLQYSAQPATVAVNVHLSYERIAWIVAFVAGGLLIVWQATRIIRRERELQMANNILAGANRQLRETRDQLVQAEKMTTLGLLAGGVAHEINNPLQTLLAGSRRILRYPDDVARHRESARLMERAAERCGAVIQNLLDYARRSQTKIEAVDLNEVLENTLALLDHQLRRDGIVLQLDLVPLPKIRGNFNELCTLFTNLLINGRDAAIQTRDSREPTIWIKTETTSAGVVLKVWDSGPGVAEDLSARIFDPFFTTKEVGAGTGLGLAIVRGIVERHHGRIAVESAAGQGATFTVFLPVEST